MGIAGGKVAGASEEEERPVLDLNQIRVAPRPGDRGAVGSAEAIEMCHGAMYFI
jgi:hypothetical protein